MSTKMNETIIKHGSLEIGITTNIQVDGETAVINVECSNSDHIMLTTSGNGFQLHVFGKVVKE